MNKYKIVFICLFTICCILSSVLYAQVDTAWVRRYNGPGNSGDTISAVTTDNAGNVYVTGFSYAGLNCDYATIKYFTNGDTAWVRRYNGPGNDQDYAVAIVTDNSGNVYVTGGSVGIDSSTEYATIKYYPNGDTAWIRRYIGPANLYGEATAIAVDRNGNVYVTGESDGNGTNSDFATIKYNSNGAEQWAVRYNGMANGGERAFAIAVDSSGNVYVTGHSDGPGTDYDYATVKYNTNGVQQWVSRYNGQGNGLDRPLAIAIDNQGNSYVSGLSMAANNYVDCATIKYNANGDSIWVRRYNGPGNANDWISAIAVDNVGSVYVAGTSLGSGTNYDYLLIKYFLNGDFAWSRRYNGPGNDWDAAYGLAVDNLHNVYLTGISAGAGTSFDCATIKYDSDADTAWITRYNGPANGADWGYAMALNASNNIYVAGTSFGVGNYDYLIIKYVQVGAVEENGIASPLARNDIIVYPNPAKTYFTIRLSQSADRAEIKIFDVSGKEVKSEELKQKNSRVTLDGIKNGVYFIKIDDNAELKKIVITK
jgi:uncharacterized delta-60 repeat protein